MSEQQRVTKEGDVPVALAKKRRAWRIRDLEQGYREMGPINLELARSAVFADEELQSKIERKLAEREKVWS